MKLTVHETLNSPGKGRGTGDDRFGYDEGSGTFWVLDGATDVGDIRVFETQESDAAWIAQTLSLILQDTPYPGGDTARYFETVMSRVREAAHNEARIDIAAAPAELQPIAAGIWAAVADDTLHVVWAGDCVLMIRGPDNVVDVITTEGRPDLETRTAKRLATATADEKRAEMRRIRALQNTTDGYAIFGLRETAASDLDKRDLGIHSGTELIAMSDGLWRLVEPYGLMTPTELYDLIMRDGLSAALKALRDHEGSTAFDPSLRVKSADDACGLYAQVD